MEDRVGSSRFTPDLNPLTVVATVLKQLRSAYAKQIQNLLPRNIRPRGVLKNCLIRLLMVVTGRHEDALWNRKPSPIAGAKPLADGFQNFPYPTLDI
jgi:hypothetical protein